MTKLVRTFDEPDELVDLGRVRSAMIKRGGMTVSYDTQQPGWRWSTDIGPLVKTDWCEVHHIGVQLSGRMGILLRDGKEFEIGPMSLLDLPAGHDAWVIGDEPVHTIGWSGVREWLAPLDTLSERVLATIVFTDLVGSTETAARMGRNAWGELLANHLQQAHDTVERFRGRLVETTGDGILATFDGAARAVRCGLALRDAAQSQDLELRVAVHTGEVDLVDDGIRGIAVHEASRILAMAAPNQVLVSSSTAGLIGDAGIPLNDLGEHELRGIPVPRRVYEVR